MRVVIFRHGIAHDRGDPTCPPDPLRKLTDDGRKKTLNACEGMRDGLGVLPTLIITSTLVRAQETARIAADVFGVLTSKIVATEAVLPEAPAYACFHALLPFHETHEEVMVVGHAPNLDLVIAQSLGGGRSAFTSLKKSGAAMLQLRELPQPHGELVWLIAPKALARMR